MRCLLIFLTRSFLTLSPLQTRHAAAAHSVNQAHHAAEIAQSTEMWGAGVECTGAAARARWRAATPTAPILEAVAAAPPHVCRAIVREAEEHWAATGGAGSRFTMVRCGVVV